MMVAAGRERKTAGERYLSLLPLVCLSVCLSACLPATNWPFSEHFGNNFSRPVPTSLATTADHPVYYPTALCLRQDPSPPGSAASPHRSFIPS